MVTLKAMFFCQQLLMATAVGAIHFYGTPQPLPQYMQEDLQ